MTAGDLGLDLLVGPYDPILAAAGVLVPRLTYKQQRNINMQAAVFAASNREITPEQRQKRRDTYWANRAYQGTVEQKIVNEQVRHIINRWRNMGQVRNR
jgi:hypothetical protein